MIQIICEPLVIIMKNLERLFKILEDWSLTLYVWRDDVKKTKQSSNS